MQARVPNGMRLRRWRDLSTVAAAGRLLAHLPHSLRGNPLLAAGVVGAGAGVLLLTATPMEVSALFPGGDGPGPPVLSGGLFGVVAGGRGSFAGSVVALLGRLAAAVIRGVRAALGKGQARDAPVLDEEAEMVGATRVLARVRGAAAWFVVRSGGVSGSINEIRGERVTVGGSPDSGIHLDHPSVSPSHAVIRVQKGVYSVSDLGSRTGTMVNGSLEAGVVIKDGSHISLGDSELFFSRVGGTNEGSVGGDGPAGGVLLVRSGPSIGQSFPVERGDLVIGRQPGEGGAQIEDVAISQRHALLRCLTKVCRLYDLNSTNGTIVDDAEVEGVVLGDGDILKFGDVELQFVHEDQA